MLRPYFHHVSIIHHNKWRCMLNYVPKNLHWNEWFCKSWPISTEYLAQFILSFSCQSVPLIFLQSFNPLNAVTINDKQLSIIKMSMKAIYQMEITIILYRMNNNCIHSSQSDSIYLYSNAMPVWVEYIKKPFDLIAQKRYIQQKRIRL